MRDYRCIVTVDKKIMTLQTFKDIVKLLPENNFIRVHNSYIVSIDKIESIERHRIRIGKILGFANYIAGFTSALPSFPLNTLIN